VSYMANKIKQTKRQPKIKKEAKGPCGCGCIPLRGKKK